MSQEPPYSTIYELILVDENNNTPVYAFTCADGSFETRLNAAIVACLAAHGDEGDGVESVGLGEAIELLSDHEDILEEHGLRVADDSNVVVIEARYYQRARLEIES